ncbi:hypothetical protein KSX_93740 [Ktedonospora formicarum]|uniref:Uncharacterized protein n=1 Tax=Ktedonospora formicarum TaxID=2778364 RepID=A0A8J3IC05_9CHLR|nr:hypothetical protein KSX_93740 [Ktedonospora formicarum]
MVLAREGSGRDPLQEQGDDLGREGLSQRIGDGLLPCIVFSPSTWTLLRVIRAILRCG